MKLILALMVYNTVRNESTMLSPYNIVFGLEPRTLLNTRKRNEPLESVNEASRHKSIREPARSNAVAAQKRQAEYYNRNRHEQDFAPQELVLARANAPPRGDSRKRAFGWIGPLMVIRLIEHDNQVRAAEVLDMAKFKLKRYAFCDLKHFNQRDNISEEPNNYREK